MSILVYKLTKVKPALAAQLDAHPTGDQEVAGSTPPGSQQSFVVIDHEIFSTLILSHLLIQEGQLSARQSLRRQSLPMLDMTNDWAIKSQHKQKL